jgi:hypothetical protein
VVFYIPFFPSNHHHHLPPHRASSAFRASLIFMPIHLLTLCIPYSQEKNKTIKSCETWLVPVDVSIVAAVRGVFVLLRVPCVQTLVPTPLPSHLSLDVRGAVLTGTAFFFIHCYMSTGRNQNCYPTHFLCIVTRVMSTVGHQAANCPKAGTPTW